MRVYGVEPNGKFREYVRTKFSVEHKEAILEDWLDKNPDGILEDGKLLMIGRQVNTNLGSTIDLLALDRVADVVVIELKRDRTPRDTLAQALEYASFAAQLDTNQLEAILQTYMKDESLTLAEYHRKYFELAPDEAVAFNKDQRIVIVGQQVTGPVRQTASFLRSKGIRATCVEFSFFQSNGGTELLSQEIVVGSEPSRPQRVFSGSLPDVTPEEFLRALDQYGKAVFKKVLEFAQAQAMPIHWGAKGFSLNVDLDGTHVTIFYCYPPASLRKQSIYTTFKGPAGMSTRTQTPDDELTRLRGKAEATGLFLPVPGGHELRCSIERAFTDEEIGKILAWCEEVAAAIAKYGPNE